MEVVVFLAHFALHVSTFGHHTSFGSLIPQGRCNMFMIIKVSVNTF